ncbi:hypothetical protein Y032_0510g2733 [Ancylostoma ceylanicum]|uniref:7TM GPCR serpentine receptor class x (Srx) domain-containing protein n=1 Tax=Ancylostoma ceylanicum TaxID=53326 RepID=A0A016WUM2_9BILA|nr:hypothetical protein Y032_0510g2733 [Ancylostoma ceylanicum]
MAFYVDMIYNVCIFVIVVIIDLMSLTKLRKTKKKFLGQRGNGLAAARESKREKRREMLLFLQAFSTSGCYSFMLVCFHVLSTQMTSNFAYFLCTTLAWELSHTLGGLTREVQEARLAVRNETCLA